MILHMSRLKLMIMHICWQEEEVESKFHLEKIKKGCWINFRQPFFIEDILTYVLNHFHIRKLIATKLDHQ